MEGVLALGGGERGVGVRGGRGGGVFFFFFKRWIYVKTKCPCFRLEK